MKQKTLQILYSATALGNNEKVIVPANMRHLAYTTPRQNITSPIDISEHVALVLTTKRELQ